MTKEQVDKNKFDDLDNASEEDGEDDDDVNDEDDDDFGEDSTR